MQYLTSGSMTPGASYDRPEVALDPLPTPTTTQLWGPASSPMNTGNLIACVYAENPEAYQVIRMHANRPRWLLKQPGLQLTLHPGPKCGPRIGYLLGTDHETCDIVLPRVKGIMERHCRLAFRANGQLIVHNFSNEGITVSYGEQTTEKRFHFEWVLGGDSLQLEHDIVIGIGPSYRFRIVVSSLNRAMIARFLQETNSNKNIHPNKMKMIVKEIRDGAPNEQEQQQQPRSPARNPMILTKKRLGEGAQGFVDLIWDVSTGNEYALKEFKNPLDPRWRTEATVLQSIYHVSHVPLWIFCGGDTDENFSPLFLAAYSQAYRDGRRSETSARF